MNAALPRPLLPALLLTLACAGTAAADEPAAPAVGSAPGASAPAQGSAPLPTPAPAPAEDASAPSTRPAVEPVEPDVQHVIIEDSGTRIEELRIRGQTQRITVKPKIGPKEGYEIVTGDGSRDPSFGAYSTRDAMGKSVWRIFSF